MLSLLEQIARFPDSDDMDALIRLVHALRPAKPGYTDQAIANIRTLIQLLKGNALHAAALRHYLLRILSARRHTSVYTDSGILPNDGFFTELFRRLSHRLLPPAIDDLYLLDCLDRVFSVDTDHVWLRAVPETDWLELFDVLVQADTDEEILGPEGAFIGCDITNRKKMALELLEAIQTLSYRISAMGLEPRLIRIHPEIEAFESPFLMQNVEVHAYLAAYAQSIDGGMPPIQDAKHLLVMLDQCDTVITKIQKSALRRGTSVALTYLLVRLTQSIDRLRKLVSLLDAEHVDPNAGETVDSPAALESPGRRAAALALGLELIEAHNRRYAVRELFASNIHLLARNVTENASRTGEHYIAEDQSEYATMFRAAAGAGLIVGCMATLKILFSYLRAAPLVEAFLFSLNYSLGFMLIHVLHFTIATKQPAMTAARIASGLHSRDGRTIDLDSLVELVVKVIRTQFVAVLGNLMTVFPMAYLIAWGCFHLSGEHLVTPQKAAYLLHDVHPLTSPALFHAAIAGVCLFLAGLISGYYDNKAVYTNMSQRVTQLRWLQRILGMERLERFGLYLENNLGGLMGNFYFGILLGTIGTIGYLLGLPLDIRHITFAAANVAIALVGVEHQITWQAFAVAVVGVLSIGTVNLLVSFSLALFVALRSRQVRFRHGLRLCKGLLLRFCSGPRDFFWPPKSAEGMVVADSKPSQ